MVSPGRYTVRLTVGEQVMEQSFALRLDPKVANSGLTLADAQEQEAVGLEITGLLTDLKKMAQSIKEEKETLENKTSLAEAQGKRLAHLTNLHEKLVTAKGTYRQPMLISQVSYLFNIVRRADQVPGRDVYERLKELKGEKARLETMMK